MKKITILAAIIAIGTIFGIMGVENADGQVVLKEPQNFKAVRASKTSLKLSWSKSSDAKGYIIYRKVPNAKTFIKYKTIKSASTLTFTEKKLKSNKTYSYKLQAFVIENGVTILSKDSYVISAIAFTKKSKKRNANSIDLGGESNNWFYGNGRSTEYIGLERWYKKYAVVALSKTQKKAKKKVLSKSLYWKSSNPEILKVTGNGELKAQGKKGKAIINIRAHNGVQKNITVYVDDYANPASFTNLDRIPAEARYLLTTYPTELKTIMKIIESQKVKKGTEIDYYGGALGSDPTDVHFGDYYETAEKLFKEEDLTMYYFDDGISIGCKDGALIYLTRYSIPTSANKKGSYQLAPCWFYFKGV
ncbi:MAG: fibronectin type III domain-containing protein [Anaerovoracaceae bacterium]